MSKLLKQGEITKAAEALGRWFETQNITPTESVMVMGYMISSILSMLDDGADEAFIATFRKSVSAWKQSQ